jgi:hypothetical protein
MTLAAKAAPSWNVGGSLEIGSTAQVSWFFDIGQILQKVNGQPAFALKSESWR